MKFHYKQVDAFSTINSYSVIYVKAAQLRFMRFLKYIENAFPETKEKKALLNRPCSLLLH